MNKSSRKPRVTMLEFRILREIDRYIRRYNIRDQLGLRQSASDVLDGWVCDHHVRRFVDRKWLKPVEGTWDLTDRALRRFWPGRFAIAFPLAGVNTQEKKHMKTGIELIAEERAAQVSREGWTPEYDDEHDSGQMAAAASVYAAIASEQAMGDRGPFAQPDFWPWGSEWYKPKDQLRNLVRAGALIAAEIDRVQREQRMQEIANRHKPSISAS